MDLITAIEKNLPCPSKWCSSKSSDSKFVVDKSSKEIKFHYRFRILSYLLDEFYEICRKYKTAKNLWYALEVANIRDNESTQRFTITDFNNYKMIGNAPINKQIHQFQDYSHEINKDGSMLDENYQISCTIDKLPSLSPLFAQELRRT